MPSNQIKMLGTTDRGIKWNVTIVRKERLRERRYPKDRKGFSCERVE